VRKLLLAGLLAASSVFSAPIFTIIPTLGPDSLTSDNFEEWAANVIDGLRNNTTPGTGVTQYIPLANATVLTGSEFLESASAGFTSWMGSVLPPTSEFGTVLYFSVKITDAAGDTMRLADLLGQETYLGNLFAPQQIVGNYRATAVGVTALGSVLDNGQAPTTLVKSLYYVGLGFTQPVNQSIPGSNQDKLDGTAAEIRALSDKTTQVCYELGVGGPSACGSVVIQDVAGIPEPGTWVLISAGLVGLGFLRRRN